MGGHWIASIDSFAREELDIARVWVEKPGKLANCASWVEVNLNYIPSQHRTGKPIPYQDSNRKVLAGRWFRRWAESWQPQPELRQRHAAPALEPAAPSLCPA